MNELFGLSAAVPATDPMVDLAALQRLLTWLSPAFPVGAFAWSAGLETAIADGRVSDRASMRDWLDNLLYHGGLKTDAIFLAEAHRASGDGAKLTECADLCLALTPSRERHEELVTTGRAFALAAGAWPTPVLETLPKPCPYPVAVGAIAAGHAIPLLATLTAYLTAIVHSQISVAVRLVPIGQTAGLTIMAELEPLVLQVAEKAASASIADLGAIAYAADIAQMRHETLPTRIFRS